MRKLLLTGLGTEQPFFPKTGNIAAAAKYFLIFNDGEFRVEVTEGGAELCVAKMMESEGEQSTPLSQSGFTQEEIEQSYHEVQEENKRIGGVVMGPVGSTYSDEDGVDQV